MNNNSRSLVVFVLCAVLAPSAELPVRTVVLYKHGVGYFERGGTLAPGESARLDFKAAEMNDVLKSLTITDNGGKVTGVRYDSAIPLNQKLGEFPFQIGEGQPLSAIFDQLKGARVEMDFGPAKVAGGIVSARLIAADREHAEREQLTLLLDTGELRNVDLAAASAIRFADAKLQLQFRDYLAALTTARSTDKRSVYIDSSDTKSREVRAEYIMPMPAWKSSYRLLFGEGGQEPTLEGWAIVDNTTGEDWTNVQMSLISGKPISFVSQLYPPKYIARLGAELPEDQAVAPKVYGGVTGGVAGGVMGGVIGGLPAAPAPLAKAASPMFRASAGNTMAEMQVNGSASADLSSIAPAGTATEIADLFQYAIRNPVTVKKNESAMLPFLQQKIAARKLIIYSDASKANPLSAAELTNNTGRTLDGGPITVYDAGAYAGEALVETVKNADKRFISYGADLGTRITTTLNSRSDNIREIHVRNGVLTTRSARIEKKTYTVHNVDARGKTLVIEHPLRPQYKLIDTPAPSEIAGNVYRFEIKIPPTGEVAFPVTEENLFSQDFAISSITPASLLIYVQNKSISDAARRQLQQIADLKTQIANVERDKARLDNDVQNVTRDEERNRQNIASLSQVSGQQQIVQDYARKLSDQETQIARLRDNQAQIETQRTSLQTQLNTLIEKLDF